METQDLSINDPSSALRSSPPIARATSSRASSQDPSIPRSTAEYHEKQATSYDRRAVAIALAVLVELNFIEQPPESSS